MPPPPARADVACAIVWHQFARCVIKTVVCSAFPAFAELAGWGAEAGFGKHGAPAPLVGASEAGVSVDHCATDGMGFVVEGFEGVYVGGRLMLRVGEEIIAD